MFFYGLFKAFFIWLSPWITTDNSPECQWNSYNNTATSYCAFAVLTTCWMMPTVSERV